MRRRRSKETLLAEAERGARRDDDVVVEIDVDRLEGVAQAGGDLDVRPRRTGVAGRMWVQDDQGGGAHLERADADLAGDRPGVWLIVPV